MEKEVVLTEEELQSRIDEAISKAKDIWQKESDAKFSQQRVKHNQELEKVKAEATENAKLTEQERIEKEQAKKFETLTKENEELKLKVRNGEIRDKLVSSKLPLFLANDSRLKGANTQEELDTAIEQVKKDYESSIPTGSNVSTNLNESAEQSAQKDKVDEELLRFRTLGLK